jgi:hypothetical protein
MDINNVIQYFGENGQLLSLKISVKDILEKNKNLSMFTANYFNQLISAIERYEMENKDNVNYEENKVSEQEGENLENMENNNVESEGN